MFGGAAAWNSRLGAGARGTTGTAGHSLGMAKSSKTTDRRMPRHWLADIGWSRGALLIRKTGVRLPLNRALVHEVLLWIPYMARLGLAAMAARWANSKRPTIWFEPDTPRPWYLMGGAALWGGMRRARSRAEADAAFYFEDITTGERLDPPLGAAAFNYGCTDISKSRVAAVFEEVFGYPLTVDPMAFAGPIVEKPEKNGVHAGRIYEPGDPMRPDHVYQRLIDTADGTGRLTDLRTLCAAGQPLLIWKKLKRPGGRFPIHSLRTTLHEPASQFTPTELERICAFTARMGLDWGGLDILRDRAEGRIYIVDVNKTDLGPVISLSWADKIRSMRRLAGAMQEMVAMRAAEAKAAATPIVAPIVPEAALAA